MTLIHSIYTCQKVKERFHLYDPVQHDGKDDGDDPREDVADDRGDSSIVTSELRHHLEKKLNILTNVKVGAKNENGDLANPMSK